MSWVELHQRYHSARFLRLDPTQRSASRHPVGRLVDWLPGYRFPWYYHSVWSDSARLDAVVNILNILRAQRMTETAGYSWSFSRMGSDWIGSVVTSPDALIQHLRSNPIRLDCMHPVGFSAYRLLLITLECLNLARFSCESLFAAKCRIQTSMTNSARDVFIYCLTLRIFSIRGGSTT